MSEPPSFGVVSTWKVVVKYYFSTEIFISLNSFSETVV